MVGKFVPGNPMIMRVNPKVWLQHRVLATQNQEARSYPSVSPIPGVSCLISSQIVTYNVEIGEKPIKYTIIVNPWNPSTRVICVGTRVWLDRCVESKPSNHHHSVRDESYPELYLSD